MQLENDAPERGTVDAAPTVARSRPEYYARILAEVSARWDKLEADEQLAAPWHQLFQQLRGDSRHVLSELLQNADDAGASWARATISGARFRFEHNGNDFTEDNFRAICAFGKSSKRLLHTVGFRGIGFKTTFSLGKHVTLLTPSVAVAFYENRFTQPCWLETAEPTDHTVVEVEIDSQDKVRALERYLREWAEDCTSLLFFRNLTDLDLGFAALHKRVLGPGPMAQASWVALGSEEEQRVLVFESAEADFPDSALAEIRQERRESQLDLPPCKVQIVVRLADPPAQYCPVYSVLPTNSQLKVPFACNAPFIQDPARTGIKPPANSPTNKWLLGRVGALAAAALRSWLDQRHLSLGDRAQGYNLLLPDLPTPATWRASTSDWRFYYADERTYAVLASFQEALGGQPVLLAASGEVASSAQCLGLPADLVDIWTTEENLQLFGNGRQTEILSGSVSAKVRERLASWGLLSLVSTTTILSRLARSPYPSRPADHGALARLWSFLNQFRQGEFFHEEGENLPWLYCPHTAVMPTLGSRELRPASEVVVVGAGKDMAQSDWALLGRYVPIADPKWLDLLANPREAETVAGGQKVLARAADLRHHLGLDSRTGASAAVSAAAAAIFAGTPGEDAINLAYIAARADVRLPDHFQYLCDDGKWRPVTVGLLADVDQVLDLLPIDWASERLVHVRYAQAAEPRDRAAWQRWVGTSNSRLRRFPLPEATSSRYYRRHKVEDLILERGGSRPPSYPKKMDDVEVEDFDFPAELWAHCGEQAVGTPEVWTGLVMGIARDWGGEWKERSEAKVWQHGYTLRYSLEHGRLASAWLARLRGSKCVLDQHGHPRLPAEVYRSCAETRHLAEVEAFLATSLDRPEYAEFLDLLGVKSRPDSADKIVDRIRALSTVPQPPVEHLQRLYGALDRTWPYLGTDKRLQLVTLFKAEALIFSSASVWEKSASVFLSNPEQIPDVSTPRHEVVSLGLWKQIGLPAEPTPDLLLAWLKQLPTAVKLSDTDLRRARRVLARAPLAVSNDVGSWLDAGGRWTPVDRLKWAVREIREADGLFPHIKEAVADLSMLPATEPPGGPLARLKPLAQVLEYRVEAAGSLSQQGQPEWLMTLATCLLRIQEPGAPTAHEEFGVQPKPWRQHAVRLSRTSLALAPQLRAVPYLDGAPAGAEIERGAVWLDTVLLVRGQGARVSRELADEVSAAFDSGQVRRAISDCIDRTSAWIEEYFEAHFQLLPEPVLEGGDLERDKGADLGLTGIRIVELSGGSEPVRLPEAGHDEAVGGDEPARDGGRSRADDRAGAPAPKWTRERAIHAFFLERGFTSSQDGYRLADGTGHWLEYSRELHLWTEYDSDSSPVRVFYFANGDLDQGIELPAEAWQMLRSDSREGSLVLLGHDGLAVEYELNLLSEWIAGRRLILRPSTFLLATSSQGNSL